MPNVGYATLQVIPSMRGVEGALKSQLAAPSLTAGADAGKAAGTGFSSGLKTALAGVGGLFVLDKVKDQLFQTLDAGSDLNETVSKTKVVFGDSAKAALAFGDDSATALGQSRQEALESLSTIGNLFVSLGLGRKKALDMSEGVVKLATDLGSFNNVPTGEALEAIRSGLVGETEPLRRFGVNLNEATIKQEAMRLGLYHGEQQITASARSQAAYSLILKQTGTAQGDFARTSSGAANQSKILHARMEDLRAKIGTALLPVYTKLLEIGQKVIGWLSEHKEFAVALAAVVGGVLTTAFGLWAASMVSAAAAAFGLEVAAGPIFLVAAAVTAVIAAAVLLWLNWDKVWNWIKNHPAIAVVISILAAPVAAFVLIIGGLKTLYENWNEIWGGIKFALQIAWGLVIKPIFEEFASLGKTIMDGAQWAWDNVGVYVFDAIGKAIGLVIWVVNTILKPIWDTIFDGLKTAWENGGKQAVETILTGLGPLIRAAEALADLFDGLFGDGGAVNDPAGIRAGGSTSVPQGASGGIVRRPTLAIIGEAGPEAVVPLNRTPGSSPLPSGVLRGSSARQRSQPTIHVDSINYAGPINDEARSTRRIMYDLRDAAALADV